MEYILLIVLCVILIIAAIISFTVFRITHKEHYRNDVHFSGGVNIETGQISTDNNYFKGTSEENENTIVTGQNYKNTIEKNILITNLNNNNSCIVNLHNEIIFGRQAGNGFFTIQDNMVSKRHCKLFLYNGKVCVNDLNSSNHTFLNDKCISNSEECLPGDIIRIGKTKLQISY